MNILFGKIKQKCNKFTNEIIRTNVIILTLECHNIDVLLRYFIIHITLYISYILHIQYLQASFSILNTFGLWMSMSHYGLCHRL